jgi:hypothetical protein
MSRSDNDKRGQQNVRTPSIPAPQQVPVTPQMDKEVEAELLDQDIPVETGIRPKKN